MLCKCHSDYLRRKLLEVGPELTLARTLKLTGQCEELDIQMAMLSVDTNSTAAAISQVNNMTATGGRKTQRLPARATQTNANAAGKQDILAETSVAQRAVKLVIYVAEKNHVSVVSQTKKQTKGRVHQVHCPDSDSDYAFRITSGLSSHNTVNVCVGGV